LSGAPPAAPAKVVAAFAALYLVWGSTYLAIALAIETLPPLLMAGARFLLAGGILCGFMRLRGGAAPEARCWRSTAVGGALFFLLGNGGVVVAQRTVPSGVVALLVASVPFWMVLLDWLRPGGVRPGGRTVAGLAVGFAGMVLLVGPGAAGGERVDPFGVAVVLAGALAWAAGSIRARGAAMPGSLLLSTGMQMAWGGVWLTLAGLAAGEWARLDPAAFTLRSLAAWGYLVVFGSLVGFTAYVWLLGRTTAARVSTYAYVNPVVAVLLGWAVLGEPLSARVAVAAAVIVGAVAVITAGRPRLTPGGRAETLPPPRAGRGWRRKRARRVP
jgi:drug/metabolite transporter (DMT)-like permease